MTEYHYSNGCPQTTLSAYVSPSDNSMVLASMTGLPAAYPYTLVLDYQEATQEVVTVTGAISGALSISRGQDGTAAQEHNAGAVVAHAVVARDLAGPQAHMVSTSPTIHGVTGGLVGATGAQTLVGKTLEDCPAVTTRDALVTAQLTVGGAPATDLVLVDLVHDTGDDSNFIQGHRGGEEEFLIAADGTIQGRDFQILAGRSMPRGFVYARRRYTDIVTGIHDMEADLYAKTLTFDAGRAFRVSVSLNFHSSTHSNFGVECWLWDETYRASDTGVVQMGAVNQWVRGTIEHYFTTTVAETKTFYLTVRADAGKTFNVKALSSSPFMFSVEDLGQASVVDVAT